MRQRTNVRSLDSKQPKPLGKSRHMDTDRARQCALLSVLLVAVFFASQVLLTHGPSSYFMGKIPAQSVQQGTLPLEDDQAVAKLPLHAGSQEVVDEKEGTSAEMAAVSTPGKLRFDWTNMTLTSPMAKTIQAHMNNCSLQLGTFHMRNRMGFGSDLHVWSQVLCNAMDENVRVWSLLPWQWRDEHVCDSSDASSLSCYFPTAELLCEGDSKVIQGNTTKLHEISSPYNKERCPSILGKDATKTEIGSFRAAAMEYLFRSISPALVQEAERQFNIIFPEGKVPQNLITVQIRWGDKKKEMKLLPAEDYVKGVQEILEQRRDSGSPVSIFLATEDPKAVQAFQEAAPKEWNIYLDQYFHDMLPYRNTEKDVYNQGPKTARDTQGRAGLVALGSVLVAMEANDFVLTTASNWSRLMNELRKNVLDPRCNQCTHMVELKFGEW